MSIFPGGEFGEAGFSGDGYLQLSLQIIPSFSRFVFANIVVVNGTCIA